MLEYPTLKLRVQDISKFCAHRHNFKLRASHAHCTVIIPVSYFFDAEEYADDAGALDATGVSDPGQLGKYVAGGIVVYDPVANAWLWDVHLDLTTDTDTLRAFVYCTPEVVDFEGDGSLEIVLGTSMGLLYVLNASNGDSIPGFPVQLGGEIQGGVAVENVVSGPELEVIAADGSGKVVCIAFDGSVVWDANVGSMVAGGVALGDVDGDGVLDVAIGTVKGQVFVLNAASGAILTGFPVDVKGEVLSGILLTRLHRDPQLPASPRKGLDIVAPSFDGHVYIIEGTNGCFSKIDIGEHVYATPVVADLDADGRLEMVVGSMSGNIFMLGLDMPALPLLDSHPGTARLGWRAVQIEGPRGLRCVHEFLVQFIRGSTDLYGCRNIHTQHMRVFF